MDNNTSYRMPDDFNPHFAVDAIRALAWAINRFVNEGPGTSMRLKRGEHASLGAMTELLQDIAFDFHDYFVDIENRTTLHLPKCEADFEALHVRHARQHKVEEPPAVYAVR